MSGGSVVRAELAPDFRAWRERARRLLASETPPEQVEWRPDESGAQLGLGLARPTPSTVGSTRGRSRVPRGFLSKARRAACYRDPRRWELLYRLLWRLTHGEPNLLSIPVDDDVHRLTRMVKSVRRDAHKMKAFVRFRRTRTAEGDELYLAWHRPDHRIVELVAPFFAERFNDQRWAILTPDRSVYWDLAELVFGPGAPASAAPSSDDLERLWRTYYGSIFNPARLKVRAMKAELPVRHWATLPETSLIPELIRDAPRATARMMAAPDHPPATSVLPAEPTLASLRAALPRCRACPLCETETRPVFGEGPERAPLMLVGEQPGDREDREGRPFVGPAGGLLDAALTEAEIDRREVFLTNAVKHFKFVSRGKWRIHKTPGQTEVTACLPWLEAEVAQVAPRLIVCLGRTATRAVLGPGVRASRNRGRVLKSRFAAPAMPTTHPAAVLRIDDRPSRAHAFRRLVEDLAQAARWLDAADSPA